MGRAVVCMLTLHEGIHVVLCDVDGDVTIGHGRGFYYDDTRYLSRYELRLDGRRPQALGTKLARSNEAVFFLGNPKLANVHREHLGIVRTRVLEGTFRDRIAITNYGIEPAIFQLALRFGADFAGVSRIEAVVEKGASPPERRAIEHEARADGKGLTLSTDRKQVHLETRVSFDRPAKIHRTKAVFPLRIAPGETFTLEVVVAPVATGAGIEAARGGDPRLSEQLARARRQRAEDMVEDAPALDTDHRVLERAYRSAVHDLASLAAAAGEATRESTVIAGIPWYTSIFARDGLVTSLFALPVFPELAIGTLRLLSSLQGTKVDRRSEEEPGKIPHSYRRRLSEGEGSLVASYETFDATPLYLATLARQARNAGRLDLVQQLSAHVERAFDWMERFGDRDGDGLLESPHRWGSGWQDSDDAVRDERGMTVEPPVALVEIQGWAAHGLRALADLFDRLGRRDRADRMRARADLVRRVTLAHFWMDDRSFFAQALDGEKQRVSALSSNPGHLLYCRMVPSELAQRMAGVLVGDALFSGWGIRTRASGQPAYDPISYHNGSVWPHDTLIAASGLAAYGCLDEARTLLDGLLAAVAQYPEARPPEVFAGYPAEPWGIPVDYIGANRPQAWASAAMLEIVRTTLGLEVDAFEHRLSLRPFALEGMTRLAWSGVHVGDARVDVEARFEGGRAEVEVHGLPDGWTIEKPEPSEPARARPAPRPSRPRV